MVARNPSWRWGQFLSYFFWFNFRMVGEGLLFSSNKKRKVSHAFSDSLILKYVCGFTCPFHISCGKPHFTFVRNSEVGKIRYTSCSCASCSWRIFVTVPTIFKFGEFTRNLNIFYVWKEVKFLRYVFASWVPSLSVHRQSGSPRTRMYSCSRNLWSNAELCWGLWKVQEWNCEFALTRKTLSKVTC